MTKEKKDQAWENRVLCSDESCIGVIGADGRCKECGLPYDGKLPDGFSPADSDHDPQDDRSYDQEAYSDPDPEPTATDDDWSMRTLCIDESCIGVIGPDGRCKECGKPHPDKS